MCKDIPFDIQTQIIKNFPVKSLAQFRSVSKQWKSFIDNPQFIKNYQNNHINHRHHLLVGYTLEKEQKFISIVDDNTFSQQRFSLTAPESFSLLEKATPLDSVSGLLGFFDRYGDRTNRKVVIWNPVVRKSISIVIGMGKAKHVVVGFGVCPDTSDIKLVKICADKISGMWEVEVFSLRKRVWKTVYEGAPFKSCFIRPWIQVCEKGAIYFLGYDLVDGRSNVIILFNLKSEKFEEVCIPDSLVHASLKMAKLNGSFAILDHYNGNDMLACSVWMRKNGVNNPFTKIGDVYVDGVSPYDKVLGFRINGEAVIETSNFDWNISDKSKIEIYKDENMYGVGIIGNQGTLSACSYMETPLLLDQSDTILRLEL